MSDKRIFFAAMFIGVFFVLVGTGAFADDEVRPIEDHSAQDVVNGMGNKAGRGIANLATGWLELPKQIYVTSKESGTVQGIFLGPLKGIGMTVVRTLAGVGELATFFVPYPGFYDPYIEPKYVWDKE
ncbi:MAG TPA: exosortase system-associated protein, TIGR04073 family [Geobacteraceae bacterium]|nr:exosortase system-associated protein, TIGR04073 family [Geobacteraceae bacterium]